MLGEAVESCQATRPRATRPTLQGHWFHPAFGRERSYVPAESLAASATMGSISNATNLRDHYGDHRCSRFGRKRPSYKDLRSS